MADDRRIQQKKIVSDSLLLVVRDLVATNVRIWIGPRYRRTLDPVGQVSALVSGAFGSDMDTIYVRIGIEPLTTYSTVLLQSRHRFASCCLMLQTTVMRCHSPS